MKTLGLRHVALKVSDPARAKEFYCRVLKMQVEWEPDADSVYLTSGGHDNLALHRRRPGTAAPSGGGLLDHIGFAVPTMADVDAWYAWVKVQGVEIAQELKTHRDGARSFYFRDPDGATIQLIYHPPIAKAASASPS